MSSSIFDVEAAQPEHTNWIGRCNRCQSLIATDDLRGDLMWVWCVNPECKGQVIKLEPLAPYLAAYKLGGLEAVREMTGP